jgi:gamma-glutamylcyclotransferase (GGCT)/AIG2-like uncharacterized protein YtfP
MPQQFITHQDIVDFADAHINLPPADYEALLDQYETMSNALDEYIAAHPDCGMMRMYSCGNLAYGVARQGFDLHNVAIYVKREITPETELEMLDWFAAQLRQVYPGIPPERIYVKGHIVRMDNMRGDGIDAMVTPIQHDETTEHEGWQIARETGERVRLSVPMRLKLVQDCRRKVPRHFAQIMRLLDWWVEKRHSSDSSFRLKSILIEIICAHLLETGMDFSDYPSALKGFFSFIAESKLQQRMLFEGCASPTPMPVEKAGPVEIFDPYNKENNIANGYTEEDRHRIVSASADGLKAIAAAEASSTRAEAASHWQDILGKEFRID